MAQQDTEIKIPTILIAVGLILYVISAFIHVGHNAIGVMLLATCIGAVIQTGLLIVAAFVAAKLLGMGFGELKTAALKFAGASLFAGGIGSLIPFGGLIGGIIFLGLLVWLFDIEMWQAIVLAIIYWIIGFIVVVILVAGIVAA